MNNDKLILRRLALEYLICANDEHNEKSRKLHRAVNDLKMIRPVVLIEELPWSQMDAFDELKLECSDEYLRSVETFMRREIFKFRNFRADMNMRPFIPVPKVFSDSGIGVTVHEETVSADAGNHIISHDYMDQLATEEAIDNLHNAVVTYDEKETNRRFELVGECIGDIIPVKKTGIDHLSIQPWDDISRYRGVMPLLMSLADEPELCHRMMRKITDISMDKQQQYLELGLFERSPWTLHCTPVLVSDLHPEETVSDFSNIWGRGTAQIFASVSKEMHDEFEIEYMKDTIGNCGLVYYGCCEPLDGKMDIVEKIPNLRKVSITPWADVNVGAEAIGEKYVLASKPNPALVGVGTLNEDVLRKEISSILAACKRNNTNVDIVLKDISSCGHRPENIFEWEKIVMELVNNY